MRSLTRPTDCRGRKTAPWIWPAGMLRFCYMRGIENGRQFESKAEILDPHHFYAAYVFDGAEKHQQDIQALIEQAQQLGYPLRYWWLSSAMDLQGDTDRLIVCVHHPSHSEDAGMDLYDALNRQQVCWDELDSAVVEEYGYLGHPVKSLEDINYPEGNHLFPDIKNEY